MIGDLRPGFGQGLIWGRSVGRRANVVGTILRDSEGLGYRSSAENAALRGIGIRYRYGLWQLTVLTGYDRRDARFGADGAIHSMPISGIHTSTTERQGKDILRLQSGGLRLRYGTAVGYGGVSLQLLAFDAMVDLRRAAKPWSFYGKQQILIGSDLHWSLQKLNLFSAWAYQPQGVWAAIGGGRWQLGSYVFISVLGALEQGIIAFLAQPLVRLGWRTKRVC